MLVAVAAAVVAVTAAAGDVCPPYSFLALDCR